MEEILFTRDAAARLGVSQAAVIRLIHVGALEAVKSGPATASWVIDAESVDEYERLMRSTLSTVEAGERLGLDRSDVWSQIQAGNFPGAKKVGGRWRIPLKAIERYEEMAADATDS